MKSIKLKGNAKVAVSRGSKWKENLIKGKLDAQINPTLLRVLRVKKNINQNSIASKVGMSVATYGSIERAKRPVSAERAEKIAKSVGEQSGRLFTALGTGAKKNKMVATVA